MITKKQEGHQFSGKEVVIEVQQFPEAQQVSDFSFKDPVVAIIES